MKQYLPINNNKNVCEPFSSGREKNFEYFLEREAILEREEIDFENMLEK